MSKVFSILFLLICFCSTANVAASPIDYINTAFENASPLYWEIDSLDVVQVYLNYDVERGAVNRQTTHWYFQIHAQPGASFSLVLNNFDNIWNGKKITAIKDNTTSVISEDGKTWRPIRGQKIAGNRYQLDVTMPGDKLYVARMQPYTLSDLNDLLSSTKNHPLLRVKTIGKTVEGRPLEIVQVGKNDAPHRVFIRARAHPWEAGGNWLVHGLVKSLLTDEPENQQFLKTFRVYILPMANKDGVVRGLTRFNMNGMDLNRKWDKKAERELNPENYAMEIWLEAMIENGTKPDLAIDLHNDSGGKLHIARPNINLDVYLENMARFEKLLRRHTWFREGSTGGSYRNPGSFGEGLLERYGIDACVYELNANWSIGLNRVPMGDDWQQLGADMRHVFYDYFTRPIE